MKQHQSLPSGLQTSSIMWSPPGGRWSHHQHHAPQNEGQRLFNKPKLIFNICPGFHKEKKRGCLQQWSWSLMLKGRWDCSFSFWNPGQILTIAWSEGAAGRVLLGKPFGWMVKGDWSSTSWWRQHDWWRQRSSCWPLTLFPPHHCLVSGPQYLPNAGG